MRATQVIFPSGFSRFAVHCAVLCLLVLCGLQVSCQQEDTIRLSFDLGKTRDEAVSIDLYAVDLQTRSGQQLSCKKLTSDEIRVSEEEVVVAQHTQVPLPPPPGLRPVLVQLPQTSYAFYAEAFDRFGFLVARGCTVERVTAQRSLSLDIILKTVAAAEGSLEAVGETSWLQHAGQIEGAKKIQLQAKTKDGLALPDVELRTLVVSGNLVPLLPVFQTGEDGIAVTEVLAGLGESQLLVHGRGLSGSPVTFQIGGLASADYQTYSYSIQENPIAMEAGNFHFDSHASVDLIAALDDGTQGQMALWRSSPDGGSWEHTRRQELLARPVCVAPGHFDNDDRPDLVVAGAGQPPAFGIHHHDDDFGDRMFDAELESLPGDIVAVEKLIPVHINGDTVTDLVIHCTTANGSELLVKTGVSRPPEATAPFLHAVQRFPIPGFASDAQVAAGDVDGDGDDELFLLTTVFGIWIIPCGDDASGAGQGSYYVPDEVTESVWPHLFANIGRNHISIADVDEDQLNDVVVVSDGSLLGSRADLQVAYGNGSLDGLLFTAPIPIELQAIHHVAVTDMNDDTHVDVLVLSNSPPQSTVLVYSGDGTGRFSLPLSLPVGMDVIDMAIADLNVDGMEDIGLLGRTTEGSFVQVKISGGGG